MHQIDGSTDVQIIHHDDGIRNVGSRYYSVYTMDIYAQNARNECISNTERLKYTVLQLYEPFNVFSYHMKDYWSSMIIDDSIKVKFSYEIAGKI